MAAKKIFSIALLFSLTLTLFSFDLPEGWFKAGSKPGSYDMGIDKGAGQDGKNVASIKSTDKRVDGFGTLMQNSSAEKYLGKRVRMSGVMKSEKVKNYAGFWLRVGQENSKKPLSFDNMYDRPVAGNTDWQKYEIVLDVPSNSSKIAYGALLNGTGQIWFDNLNFEIVDTTIAVTGKTTNKIPSEPSNLNFEK